LDLDILGDAPGDLFIVELDLYPQIAAPDATGSRAAPAAAPATAEEAAENVIAENVSKLAEDIIHVHPAAAKTAAIARETGMSIAVVLGPFIRIAEHLVGFRGLFEFFFGRLVAGITVGVELHGHLAIGLLDLIGRSAFRHAQYFVIISF